MKVLDACKQSPISLAFRWSIKRTAIYVYHPDGHELFGPDPLNLTFRQNGKSKSIFQEDWVPLQRGEMSHAERLMMDHLDSVRISKTAEDGAEIERNGFIALRTEVNRQRNNLLERFKQFEEPLPVEEWDVTLNNIIDIAKRLRQLL